MIEVLNRYLAEMSDAIMDHGGTLVAYMGDGIMAVFGAPIEQDDHADRALAAAARDARRAPAPLQRVDATRRGMGEGFEMGIGLNSGPVMSGQVGSERRLEYTAIGDTTNTAARLEGMTKGTGHQLFVADATDRRCAVPTVGSSWSASSRSAVALTRSSSGPLRAVVPRPAQATTSRAVPKRKSRWKDWSTATRRPGEVWASPLTFAM